MGLRDFSDPLRAGGDVSKYNGWFMSLIIKDFVDNKDLTVEYDRYELKRAIMISDEVTRFAKGERISV